MMRYQPDFYKGGPGHRKECQRRLKNIRESVSGGRLMLDIGCAEGYYAFGLRDIFVGVDAIDNVQSNIDAAKATQRGRPAENISFKCIDVTEACRWTTKWDLALYMSVHHHIINQHGFEGATSILKRLSEKCESMIFDMGEKAEKGCEAYKWWQALPDTGGDQDSWITRYVLDNTEYTAMRPIGESPVHGIKRRLWQLTK